MFLRCSRTAIRIQRYINLCQVDTISSHIVLHFVKGYSIPIATHLDLPDTLLSSHIRHIILLKRGSPSRTSRDPPSFPRSTRLSLALDPSQPLLLSITAPSPSSHHITFTSHHRSSPTLHHSRSSSSLPCISCLRYIHCSFSTFIPLTHLQRQRPRVSRQVYQQKHSLLKSEIADYRPRSPSPPPCILQATLALHLWRTYNYN
jgi:hypothetical protein